MATDGEESGVLLEAWRRRLDIRRGVLRWAKANMRQFQWRRPGRSAFEVLVAEILLKRTTSAAAAKVYSTFVRSYPSALHLYNAPEAELANALTPVGLHRQRARDVKRMAEWLVKQEGSQIPPSLPRLLAVPGLGEYSARAILSFGCGCPVAVVDANVERVYARVFAAVLSAGSATQMPVQRVADLILSKRAHERFNFALLDLGALVCRYQNPKCAECPLRGCCDFAAGSYEPQRVPEGGIAVRRARMDRGMSLVELSRRSGVSKLTIVNLEAGRTRPRHETIEKLRAALGV